MVILTFSTDSSERYATQVDRISSRSLFAKWIALGLFEGQPLGCSNNQSPDFAMYHKLSHICCTDSVWGYSMLILRDLKSLIDAVLVGTSVALFCPSVLSLRAPCKFTLGSGVTDVFCAASGCRSLYCFRYHAPIA